MNIDEFISERVNCDNNARLVYVTISGSDLYGFNSPDSDTDYRGCYQLPTMDLLGLDHPPQHIKETVKADIVLYELKKECQLLVAGNCNVVEHLLAEPIKTSPQHKILQDICRTNLNMDGLYHSYKGMATFNYKKFIKDNPKPLVKKYLYVLRGLMAGIYYLENLLIEPNIYNLNKKFGHTEVGELIEMKKDGFEKATTTQNKDYDDLITSLFEYIDEIWKPIRNCTTTTALQDDIERFLIGQRKDYL